MERHLYLRTSLLLSLILAGTQLQIPLESAETDEQLETDIHNFFKVIGGINTAQGCYSFITYTGSTDLKPSLEQRLMEHFSMPIYTVGSQNGSLNHRYSRGRNMVITLFSGLNDPTLAALNDSQLSSNSQFFSFLYIPPHNDGRVLTMGEIQEFFSWCWDRKFVRSLLSFRGESEFETWTYFYFTNITVTRVSDMGGVKKNLRSRGFRFLVQAANDIPTIFWYNSSEQADVMGGGNISLTGPLGILMVEFMRYINATMDILPIQSAQNSNYEILFKDPRVDIVANLVANDSYLFSPMVTDTQICLLLPHRRRIPFNRYLDKAVTLRLHMGILIVAVCVFGVKYMAHRRRSVMDTLFSTFRFGMGMPLPGGQLERLPLADKILEVYSFLFVGILIGVCGSLLSTALTAGVYYPPITDVESMRASGLRILTQDPTVLQAFKDNYMPSSLLDLVDLVDLRAISRNFIDLNDSFAYVARSHNWMGYKLYQEHLKNKKFVPSGPQLCSTARHLRIPISPYSPLRFIFEEYFSRVFESGLQQKWLLMGFQKLRQVFDIQKLPADEPADWKTLNLDFFSLFIKIYIGGMLLSTVVFVIELLYKRYGNR